MMDSNKKKKKESLRAERNNKNKKRTPKKGAGPELRSADGFSRMCMIRMQACSA